MAESLHERVERIEREYRSTTLIGRRCTRRIKHWEEIGEAAALWIKTHPKADPDAITKAKRRKKRANDKEHWWRLRRAKADRTKVKLRHALRTARAALRRARRRRWRRRPIRWSGNPQNVVRRVKLIIRYSQFTAGHSATVTSTTGGSHAPNSWHYSGHAADEVEDQMVDLQHDLLEFFGAAYFLELFGPAGWYVKNGTVYQGHFPDHGDHIHAAA